MKKYLLQVSIGFLLLLPLYASAETASSSNATTTVTSVETDVDTSTSTEKSFTLCSQDAIEKRDTGIASSRALYNIAMTNALKDRKNKEKAAVAIASESKKKDAIKFSVNTYKNLVKTAQNNLTDAREQAWKDFENDIASCRAAEDVANTIQDEADTANAPALIKVEGETKTIKDTIKEQFDAFKSLFN
jgi:hypothetical protein